MKHFRIISRELSNKMAAQMVDSVLEQFKGPDKGNHRDSLSRASVNIYAYF